MYVQLFCNLCLTVSTILYIFFPISTEMLNLLKPYSLYFRFFFYFFTKFVSLKLGMSEPQKYWLVAQVRKKNLDWNNNNLHK